MIIRTNEAWIGWIETGNVSDITYIALHRPELFTKFDYALISCLDSDRYPSVTFPSLIRLLNQEKPLIKNFTRGIITTGSMIVDLATIHSVFHGYDEVWFFNELPIVPPPQDHYLFTQDYVAETSRIGNDKDSAIDQLIAWQHQENAVVGMSDGIGLSYSTLEESVHQTLSSMVF